MSTEPRSNIEMPATGRRSIAIAVLAALLYGCAGGAPTREVSEADIRNEYDRVAAQLTEKQEYLVRHILVGTEAQAWQALNRINAGAPFAVVAREVSQDPGSRDKGGELGWNLPQFFIEEFSRTMTSLAPRGLSKAPTRTRFGWHVIDVMAVRPFIYPPYEQVHDRIAESLRRKAQRKTP